MQFQSGVSVEVASVTGVLGAGEEVAVDFGLEDGGDEVGGVVVVARCPPLRVFSAFVRVAGVREVEARPDQFERTSGTTTGATVIRRSKGDSALFAAAGEPVLLMTEATGDLDLPSVLP